MMHMAKDRRHQKKTPWQDRRVRIVAAAGALALVILLITVLTRPQKPPSDSTTIPPVAVSTTSAVNTTLTTTTATTTTVEETTTTETETTTTTRETTTTEVTTTAPPQNYDDGSWNLLLVNPWNPLSESWVRDESNLVYASNGEYVDYRIVDQLNAMLEAGAEYGLYVTSGYRDYDTQTYLYENKVDRVMAAEGCSYEEALDIAATEVFRPGTSEHHTGLAVDLLHNECWELEEYWEDSAAFDWMMEHCADYGFILRYPKNAQHITGAIYEPWHYRYVGTETAQKIHASGLTLEEYLTR